MSIAGGYYRAVEDAARLKMDCVQIFTKNNNQWRAKPLSQDDISRFQEALAQTGIRKPCAHDSYLINLASPQAALWKRSLDAFVVELERAFALGLEGVVMHPGSYVDSTEQAGLARVVKGLDTHLSRTDGMKIDIWVETTAGQGSSLGYRFEHLRPLLRGALLAARAWGSAWIPATSSPPAIPSRRPTGTAKRWLSLTGL